MVGRVVEIVRLDPAEPPGRRSRSRGSRRRGRRPRRSRAPCAPSSAERLVRLAREDDLGAESRCAAGAARRRGDVERHRPSRRRNPARRDRRRRGRGRARSSAGAPGAAYARVAGAGAAAPAARRAASAPTAACCVTVARRVVAHDAVDGSAVGRRAVDATIARMVAVDLTRSAHAARARSDRSASPPAARAGPLIVGAATADRRGCAGARRPRRARPRTRGVAARASRSRRRCRRRAGRSAIVAQLAPATRPRPRVARTAPSASRQAILSLPHHHGAEDTGREAGRIKACAVAGAPDEARQDRDAPRPASCGPDRARRSRGGAARRADGKSASCARWPARRAPAALPMPSPRSSRARSSRARADDRRRHAGEPRDLDAVAPRRGPATIWRRKTMSPFHSATATERFRTRGSSAASAVSSW